MSSSVEVYSISQINLQRTNPDIDHIGQCDMNIQRETPEAFGFENVVTIKSMDIGRSTHIRKNSRNRNLTPKKTS
jgi:hypothetical protein